MQIESVESTGKIVKRIWMRMELSFRAFGRTKKDDFLSELAQVSGLMRDDIDTYWFRPGCVDFVGELPAEIVDKIVRICKKLDHEGDAELSDEESIVAEFIRKWKISRVKETGTVRQVHLRSKRTPDPRDDAKILFVHGWHGGEGTWANVPKCLAEMVGIRSLGEYRYLSEVTIWHHSPRITDIANNLGNWLRNRLEGSEEIGIVAHSMGGIVVRKMLVTQLWSDDPIDGLVRQVTFVASPHNGVPLSILADKVPLFKGLVARNQLRDLNPNSDFLFDLNNAWARWRQWNPRCSVRSIYGTDDAVVPSTSARGLDPEAVAIFGDHTGIVKQDDPKGEFLLTLKRFVAESGLGSGTPFGAADDKEMMASVALRSSSGSCLRERTDPEN